MIGLVVVAHQMQNPVQNENPQFIVQRPPEEASVFAGHDRSNRDIAKIGGRGSIGSRGGGGKTIAPRRTRRSPQTRQRDGFSSTSFISSTSTSFLRGRTIAAHTSSSYPAVHRERQYIRCPLFATEATVPASHLRACHQTDRQRMGPKTQASQGAREEAVESRNGNTNSVLAIENHVTQIRGIRFIRVWKRRQPVLRMCVRRDSQPLRARELVCLARSRHGR